MFESIQKVRSVATNARLDCCPYDGDSNKTGFFIRLGPNGPWLSNVRRSAQAAWRNAEQRLNHRDSPDPDELPLGPSNGQAHA